MKSNSPVYLDGNKAFTWEGRGLRLIFRAACVFCFFLFALGASAANSTAPAEAQESQVLAWFAVAIIGLLIVALHRSVVRLERSEAELHEARAQVALSEGAAQLGAWVWDHGSRPKYNKGNRSGLRDAKLIATIWNAPAGWLRMV